MGSCSLSRPGIRKKRRYILLRSSPGSPNLCIVTQIPHLSIRLTLYIVLSLTHLCSLCLGCLRFSLSSTPLLCSSHILPYLSHFSSRQQPLPSAFHDTWVRKSKIVSSNKRKIDYSGNTCGN